MSDNSIFVDSNIFLYAFSDRDNRKQTLAAKILLGNASISTQVINEVSNNMLKKMNFTNNEIKDFVTSCYGRYSIVNLSEELFVLGCELREKYYFSYYDSLIVSAALVANATTLYSEDMQHQMKINDTLTIINPFL